MMHLDSHRTWLLASCQVHKSLLRKGASIQLLLAATIQHDREKDLPDLMWRVRLYQVPNHKDLQGTTVHRLAYPRHAYRSIRASDRTASTTCSSYGLVRTCWEPDAELPRPPCCSYEQPNAACSASPTTSTGCAYASR